MEMLKTKGTDLKGKTCLISGSGNVAQYTRTTMALNKEKQDREVEQNSETTSQFGLQAATRPVSYTHL